MVGTIFYLPDRPKFEKKLLLTCRQSAEVPRQVESVLQYSRVSSSIVDGKEVTRNGHR